MILIVADALRADALGIYGGADRKTPWIDQLSSQSLIAEHAYSAASWTPPSMASLFTSTFQSTHGVTHSDADKSQFNILDAHFVTLAEALQSAGFHTGAISSQAWVSPKLGFAQGFDEFKFVASINDQHETERVVLEGVHWLELNRERQFFLLLNILNPHDPYEAPEPFASLHWSAAVPPRLRFPDAWGWEEKTSFLANLDQPEAKPSAEEIAFLRASYQAEVSYLDWNLGMLMRELKVLDLAADTLVVLTSDHGESFMEHGHFYHGDDLYNVGLHVPMIFSSPQLFPDGQRITHPVSGIDLFPTVLKLMGVPVPEGLQGQPIDAAPRRVYSEGYGLSQFKLQDERWSAIVSMVPGRGKLVELFDLVTDPGETRDVAGEHLDVAKQFEAEIQKILRANRARRSARGGATSDLDQEAASHLRALGYLQ